MNTKNRAGSLLGQGLLAITLLATLGMMTGCGSGGGGTPVQNAVPTGYYGNNGVATVLAGASNASVTITDLQGMIYNNRLIMMSVAQGLSYDGTITVSGNSYSGSVTVFRDGATPITATVDGMISQGSSVSGVLTGTGPGSGSFTLNYHSTLNTQTAAIANIVEPTGWAAVVGGSQAFLSLIGFTISNVGVIAPVNLPTDGVFNNCSITGTVTAINGTNLYEVNVTLTGCTTGANGSNYSGYATTTRVISPDVVLVVTNGTYSLNAEFQR